MQTSKRKGDVAVDSGGTKQDALPALVLADHPSSSGKQVFRVDVRPEISQHLFGFRPQERIITSRGIMMVIGVSKKHLLVVEGEMDGHVVEVPFRLKNEFDNADFYPIRTKKDRDFVSIASQCVSKQGRMSFLDLRPEEMMKRFGFRPKEHVLTPAGHTVTIGIDIRGALLFEMKSDPMPLSYPYHSQKEFEEVGFRAVRTKADQDFVAIAVERLSTEGAVLFLDVRPASMSALGFFPGDKLLTFFGLGEVLGMNIDRQFVFELRRDTRARTFVVPPTKEEFERLGLRPIRSKEEKDFIAIAKPYESPDGELHFIDVRPKATQKFGFLPEQIAVTPVGLVTIMGLNIDKRIVCKKYFRNPQAKCGGAINRTNACDRGADIPSFFPDCKTKEEFAAGGYHPIQTKADQAFLTIATEYRSPEGEIHLVDSRPETLGKLGFRSGESIFTPHGVGIVIGVDVCRRFLVMISGDTVPFVSTFTKKEEFERAGYRPLRTKQEKDFVAIATPYTHKSSEKKPSSQGSGRETGISDTTSAMLLDMRPESMLRVLGVQPQDRILTHVGLATCIGLDIEGNLVVTLRGDEVPTTLPISTKQQLERSGWRPVRTKEERDFAAVAIEHSIREGDVVVLIDTRPKAVLAQFGFSPQELVITPKGLATVIGLSIDHKLLVRMKSNNEPLYLPKATREQLRRADLQAIRTKREKAFIEIATEYAAKTGDVYLVDARPETTQPLGFLPQQRVITPRGLGVVIGMNINQRIVFALDDDPEPFILPFTTRREFEGAGFQPIRTAKDESFLKVAVPFTTKSGDQFWIDPRPEAMLLRFGLRAQDRLLTGNGVATVLGLNIDGQMICTLKDQPVPVFLPFANKEEMERGGVRAIRSSNNTDNDKNTGTKKDVVDDNDDEVEVKKFDDDTVFSKHAVEHLDTDGNFVFLDIRPETLKGRSGLLPGERFHQPGAEPPHNKTTLTAIGVDINGVVYYQVDEHPLLHGDIYFQSRQDLITAGFVVCRPSVTQSSSSSSGPSSAASSASVSVSLSAVAAMVKRASLSAGIARRPHQMRSNQKPSSISPSTSSAATNTTKSVTLPSGAVYRGTHTRAGQRHGKGEMKMDTPSSSPSCCPLSSSWRYKGQWQQGVPHGTGMMRIQLTGINNGLVQGGKTCLSKSSYYCGIYEGQWVHGVPHGSGTLTVEDMGGVRLRRYRGRWMHGRRVVSRSEQALIRLSGGIAVVASQPQSQQPKAKALPISVPTKGKKDIQKGGPRTTTTQLQVCGRAAATQSPLVAAHHFEVSQMVASLVAACRAVGVENVFQPTFSFTSPSLPEDLEQGPSQQQHESLPAPPAPLAVTLRMAALRIPTIKADNPRRKTASILQRFLLHTLK